MSIRLNQTIISPQRFGIFNRMLSQVGEGFINVTGRKKTKSPERATVAEKTTTGERAISCEKTISRKRVNTLEKTTVAERSFIGVANEITQ